MIVVIEFACTMHLAAKMTRTKHFRHAGLRPVYLSRVCLLSVSGCSGSHQASLQH